MEPVNDLFISHANADRDAVQNLCADLEAADLKLFVDINDPVLLAASERGDLTPGESDHLRRAVLNCCVFVFIASKASIRSGWMPWELGLAHGAIGRVEICELEPGVFRKFGKREYMQLYGGAIFSPENAAAHLRQAVAKAKAEWITPSDRERDRESGKRFAARSFRGGGTEAARDAAGSGTAHGLETAGGATDEYLARTEMSSRRSAPPAGPLDVWLAWLRLLGLAGR